jgi:hypothetical protein
MLDIPVNQAHLMDWPDGIDLASIGLQSSFNLSGFRS